jgi:hypothetical protein
MTTVELLATLTRDCPNGVSFDPMAIRLLRQKVLFEDGQIEDLKSEMFQLGELWFSSGMILSDETQLALEERVRGWLEEYGFFSVERLFKEFCPALRHIASPELLAAFLQHLGFSIIAWKKSGYFGVQHQVTLEDCLASIVKMITGWLEKTDRPLTVNEIEQSMPHLTEEVIESIRTNHLPGVHKIEVGEVACWFTADSIHLPEDFSDKLTTAVDILISLEEKISISKIEFALNLFYRTRFREEYSLNNKDTFMRICEKNYRGVNNLFFSTINKNTITEKKDNSVKRVRSQNTQFSKLGVPIGAQLKFIKDSQITCIVQDGINKVRYDGNIWAISSLAKHLLGVSAANGFAYFSFEGITLWDRRIQLDRKSKDKQGGGQMRCTTSEPKNSNGIDPMGRPSPISIIHKFQTDGANLSSGTQGGHSETHQICEVDLPAVQGASVREPSLKMMADKGLARCKGTAAMYERAQEQTVTGVVARTILKLCACHRKGSSYRLHQLQEDCRPFAKVNRKTGVIDLPKAIRSALTSLMRGTEGYYDEDGTLVKACDPVEFTIEKVRNLDQWIIHFNDY